MQCLNQQQLGWDSTWFLPSLVRKDGDHNGGTQTKLKPKAVQENGPKNTKARLGTGLGERL
jgi:hypothetical protein